MAWFDMAPDPAYAEQAKASVWATQNGVNYPGANVMQLYRQAMAQQGQRTQGLADMADEAKAFTSTDPATRATAPGAGRGLAADPAVNLTGAYKVQPKAPAIDLTGAYKVQPREMTDQDRAREAVAQNQARMDGLYKQVQGSSYGIDPNGGLVGGALRDIRDNAMSQGGLAGRGVLDASNGGGAMGGYGYAARDAINAGALGQMDQNTRQFGLDISKYNANAQSQHDSLLHSIATSDPTFANYDALDTQNRNFANQDRSFNAGLAQQATDRQDRLNQQASANQQAFASGGLSAAGSLLGNPTAMAGIGGALGSVVPGVGNVIGAGAGAVTGAIMNGLGLGKPPTPAPAQYNPNSTASAPHYGLASVPDGAATKPYQTAGQPKRYGLFGGV